MDYNDDPDYEENRQAHDLLYDDDDTCPECGSSMYWEDCWKCGGQGFKDGEELMQEDPLWYDEDDEEDCDICDRAGGWWVCFNQANHEEKID